MPESLCNIAIIQNNEILTTPVSNAPGFDGV